MKQYTSIGGEVYTAKERFNYMWQVIGFDIYKNDTWLTIITSVDNESEAIATAIDFERYEDAAEKQFLNQHPELNP